MLTSYILGKQANFGITDTHNIMIKEECRSLSSIFYKKIRLVGSLTNFKKDKRSLAM